MKRLAAVALVSVVSVVGCHQEYGRGVVVSAVSTATPTGPVALTPNAQGYIRVQSVDHSVRCSLTAALVACQGRVRGWPQHPDGSPVGAVSITATGDFEAVDADLGQLSGLVTLQSGTYAAQGWTIVARTTGTDVTNQTSGHGMSFGDDGFRRF